MILISVLCVCFCVISMTRAKAARACMTVLVGKGASETGEVLVGHNEDAEGRFVMQTHLVHKLHRGPGKKIQFEPGLAQLPLPESRTSLLWSEARTFNGEPSVSAFCDFFVNGNGVVICSNNCASSREDKPSLTNGGIGYGLRRLVAEEAISAKHAVEIASNLVEKYGYASSGRSYSFADRNEIWVMQIVNGKHYAIQRVPDDEVCVIPNHYTIHEPDSNAPGYKDLVSYAEKRGWYDPKEGPFDFARVYQAKASWGMQKNVHRHVMAFEILLELDLSDLLKNEWESLPFSVRPARKVSIATIKRILRTHFEGTPSDTSNGATPHFMKPMPVCNEATLESTIAEIRHEPERIIIRRALGRPCMSAYLPWYFGISSIPEGYERQNPDEALATHFNAQASDMDYCDDAWFKSMGVQAAADILYAEKGKNVQSEVKSTEERIERELQMLDSQIELRLRNDPDVARAMMEGAVKAWAVSIQEGTRHLLSMLETSEAEPIGMINNGFYFKVRFTKVGFNPDDLDLKNCKCGPSYVFYDKWSECAACSKLDCGSKCFELEFRRGAWLEDAVPCLMDLYIILTEKSGKKHAGRVKIRVI